MSQRNVSKHRLNPSLLFVLILMWIVFVPACREGLEPGPGPSTISSITLPPTELLGGLNSPAIAVSPDGTQIVSVVLARGVQQLYRRSIDQVEGVPMPGTEGAGNPFFSPDGSWVGFFADGALKKISMQDGSVFRVCEALRPRGGVWGPSNSIVFTPTLEAGLWKVSASGGEPEILTQVGDEVSHRWPDLLPDSRAVLYVVRAGGGWNDANIVLQRLDTGERRVLVEGGTQPRYMPSGHLVFARSGALMAARFDLERLEVLGTAAPVVEGVMANTRSGAAQFSVAGSAGTLVYVAGAAGDRESELVWVDREGSEMLLPSPPGIYQHPRLSPNGQQIALVQTGTNANIFVYDIPSESFTQLTLDFENLHPVWTPDGERLTFRSTRSQPANVFWKRADGTGEVERLTESEHSNEPSGWSPDGQELFLTESHPSTSRDIWVCCGAGALSPRPILRTDFEEGTATVSPDGRWMAYVSNQSGRYEVYVRAFPGPGEEQQVSGQGGAEPVWAPDGSEIFYRRGNQFLVVDVITDPSLGLTEARQLFEGPYEPGIAFRPNYDVASDGNRFLMLRATEQTTQLHVVSNWFEELERRLP